MEESLKRSTEKFLSIVSRRVYDAEVDMKARVLATISKDSPGWKEAQETVEPRKYAEDFHFSSSAIPAREPDKQKCKYGRCKKDVSGADSAVCDTHAAALIDMKTKAEEKKRQKTNVSEKTASPDPNAVPEAKMPKKRAKKSAKESVLPRPEAASVASLDNLDLDIDSVPSSSL